MLPLIKIYRFFQISFTEQKLFLEAVLLLAVARMALLLIKFKTLWRWLEIIGMKQSNRAQNDVPTYLIARAIARAAPFIPGATCLPRALTGMIMLSRRGYAAKFCIGASKTDGEFGAHAWVEYEGRPVIGAKAHFHTLLVLGFPS